MTPRLVEPEWLDELPADDPAAIRSRRDLRRVNAWMQHSCIIARLLEASFRERSPRLIVEVGAGDGSLMLALARRLAPRWKQVKVLLVDRCHVVSHETVAEFERLEWPLETVRADIFDWLAKPFDGEADVMMANLFLHHFHPERLKMLLRQASERSGLFLACEPRRSGVAMAGSRLLGLIGCNAVSRHDAVVSVRAGFTGRELSGAWPKDNGWDVQEGPAGLFSHYFLARKTI